MYDDKAFCEFIKSRGYKLSEGDGHGGIDTI